MFRKSKVLKKVVGVFVLTLAIRYVRVASFSYVLLRLRLLSAFARTAPGQLNTTMSLSFTLPPNPLRGGNPSEATLCSFSR